MKFFCSCFFFSVLSDVYTYHFPYVLYIVYRFLRGCCCGWVHEHLTPYTLHDMLWSSKCSWEQEKEDTWVEIKKCWEYKSRHVVLGLTKIHPMPLWISSLRKSFGQHIVWYVSSLCWHQRWHFVTAGIFATLSIQAFREKKKKKTNVIQKKRKQTKKVEESNNKSNKRNAYPSILPVYSLFHWAKRSSPARASPQSPYSSIRIPMI